MPGTGSNWWEKTRDTNSLEFKKATADLLKLKTDYETYLYLMSFTCLKTERQRLRTKFNKN